VGANYSIFVKPYQDIEACDKDPRNCAAYKTWKSMFDFALCE
jgi:hypothetical protein